MVVVAVELIDLSNLGMTSFLRSNNNNEILIGKNDKMMWSRFQDFDRGLL